MAIFTKFVSYLRGAAPQGDYVDAEIREELEFHLAMRTEDNIAAGMNPEEARRDACQRFGDVEAKRRQCRQIAMGPRLLVRKLEWIAAGALVVAILGLSSQLLRVQGAHRDRVEALTATIEWLQENRNKPSTPEAWMSRVSWRTFADKGTGSTATARDEVGTWNGATFRCDLPWSDWTALDDDADQTVN